MNSKIIALIVATAVVGGGVVVYQRAGGLSGVKDRVFQKVDQKVNNAISDAKELTKDKEGDNQARGHDQTPSRKEVEDMINFKNVKSPQDFAEEAKKVGPYTCYMTIVDKKTGEEHKMTVSSDGKVSYIYSSDKGTKAYGKVWVTKDAMYIESSDENGEVHNIKISGQMASAYQQAIGGVWYNEIKAMSNTSGGSATASYQVKCYRNKVDIPHLDESKFKSFNFNMQQGAGVQGGSGATNGNFQMNMPDFNK